jgi:hypothetical protein
MLIQALSECLDGDVAEQNKLMDEEGLLLSVHGFDAWPGFWSDPLCKRDFTKENFRRFMPRILAASLWFLSCVYLNNLSQAWLQSNLAGWYEAQWGLSQATFVDTQAWLRDHDSTVYQQRFGNRTPEEVEHWYKLHSPLWYNNTVLVYQNKTLVLFDLGFLLFNKVESTWWAFVWVLIPHVFILFRYIFFPGPFSIRWTLLSGVEPLGMLVSGAGSDAYRNAASKSRSNLPAFNIIS